MGWKKERIEEGEIDFYNQQKCPSKVSSAPQISEANPNLVSKQRETSVSSHYLTHPMFQNPKLALEKQSSSSLSLNPHATTRVYICKTKANTL